MFFTVTCSISATVSAAKLKQKVKYDGK